jgi:hypothetical protein
MASALICNQRQLMNHQRQLIIHQRPLDSPIASNEFMLASISFNGSRLNGFQGQAGALAGRTISLSWPLLPGQVNY